MQTQIPSQSYVWGVLQPRFEAELSAQKMEIWRLSGLLEMLGHLRDNFTGVTVGEDMIREDAGHVLHSWAIEVEYLQFSNNLGMQVGGPRNCLIPELGQELL